MFWLPTAYKIYVYIILYFIKCAIALHEKQYTYIKTLLLKNTNHHLNLHQRVLFSLGGFEILQELPIKGIVIVAAIINIAITILAVITL